MRAGERAREPVRSFALRRRPWAAPLALLLALGLTISPPAASPAAAATGRLLLTTAATYTVDPAAAAVRVSVVATFLNDKPSDNDFFYYWRDLTWAVHPEATNVRVRDGTGALAVTPVAEDGFVEAQFRLRRNLLYRQSVTLTITWDLAGGAPRSATSIRVGEAFAAFDLWAWGDPGTSSVRATLPAGYEVETFGSTVQQTSLASGVTLEATGIGNTDEFWTSVTAVREAGYAAEALSLPGGIELEVRGWPEDDEWRTKVSDTLGEALPALQELIGLPWPIDGVVEVTEVYTPLLEGYAGIFYTLEDRIDITEDLDVLVIIHEGSHAWFNDSLFRDRWIDEGLADTYAAAAMMAIGEGREQPDTPRANDDGRIDLDAWGDPGRITDETEAVERYGYNTSWYVVSEIFEELGAAKMRAVLEAADARRLAYAGAGQDEPHPSAGGWKRFLDLLEEVGGSEKAEALFREYVVTASGARDMDSRSVAREAYADLTLAGDGWLPPLYVREVMGSWAFPKAMLRIDEAEAVLELRDDVAAAADSLDLEPGPAFETAYEAADDGFEAAEAAGEAELEALVALHAAYDAVTAPLDIVASIGLMDVKPRDAYEEAAAEYEAGRLEAAEVAAAEALAIVGEGPRIGRERLAVVGGAGLLVLVVAVLLARRRRRRRAALLATASMATAAAAAAAAGDGVATSAAPLPTPWAPSESPPWAVSGPPPGASSEPPPTAPVDGPSEPVSPKGPYGTLAPDSPAPPPSTAGDAGPEGGAADGEAPGAAT